MTVICPSDCKHDWKDIWEDTALLGLVYFGKECRKCRAKSDTGAGPLDLGTYK